jgi:anti-sigma factor RsiW
MPDDRTLLLHAYLDGQLDPAQALQIERELRTDPALAAEGDRLQALRRVLAEKLPRSAAPPGLARRIETAVGLGRASASASPSWRALAASVLVAALAASGTTWLAFHPERRDATAQVVVASHVRALMAPLPVDVGSSDRHTVKPWFAGRIPQAPRVVDLGEQGFPLVGGRIDVVEHTPVPTLVYRHHQHLISLTAMAASSAPWTSPGPVAGYNLVTWSDAGVRFWAVSELAMPDLDRFAAAFRAADPER